MKKNHCVWIIEEGIDTNPYWAAVYVSEKEDWAEQEFENRISDLPEQEHRLIKREVLCHYKPS